MPYHAMPRILRASPGSQSLGQKNEKATSVRTGMASEWTTTGVLLRSGLPPSSRVLLLVSCNLEQSGISNNMEMEPGMITIGQCITKGKKRKKDTEHQTWNIGYGERKRLDNNCRNPKVPFRQTSSRHRITMRSNGFVLAQFLFVVSQSCGVYVHRLASDGTPACCVATLHGWLAMDVRA